MRGKNKVLAFDQSLTSTGYCVIDMFTGEYEVGILTPPKGLRDSSRLLWIHSRVSNLIDSYAPEAIAMEGYAFGARSRAHSLGELGGVIKLKVIGYTAKTGCGFYIIPPTTLKKYITGKGNSNKDIMLLSLYKRFGEEFDDNNKADAFSLAILTVNHLLGKLPAKFSGVSYVKHMQEVSEQLGSYRENI